MGHVQGTVRLRKSDPLGSSPGCSTIVGTVCYISPMTTSTGPFRKAPMKEQSGADYVPPISDAPGEALAHLRRQPDWDPTKINTDAVRSLYDHPFYNWSTRMTIVGLCALVDRLSEEAKERDLEDRAAASLCDIAWNS